jgi:hypothetical protein
MDEQNLYRDLVTWLRSRYPHVFTEWERERKQRQALVSRETSIKALPGRQRSALDRLSPSASATDITRAIQQELESMGISGGTPGVTPDGVPCIHLTKKGVYGRLYEESITLARIRDTGYRRHLKQVFS